MFSITDHDTINGTLIAQEMSSDFPFVYLTGIELSSRYEKKKVEVLGYNFDILDNTFNQQLKSLQNARKLRIYKVISNLANIGIEISYEDIMKQIGEGVSAGRPHFARALVEKGQVSDLREAFDKYLGEGKPGYVPRETIEPKKAIRLIHSASGTAILPHPLLVEAEDLQKLEYYLDLLLTWGLEGIEVYYNYKYHCPHLSEKTIRNGIVFLENYCKKNNLLMTGGSDFHQHKPIFGEVNVPEEEIEKLFKHFTS
ncbi:MAG: PHP domain-containing protein [Candidatus Heimdallarchaeota archaeon]|nr:PHP domain-containing protein [Candidatus Heimdallarchaeota archaeon]